MCLCTCVHTSILPYSTYIGTVHACIASMCVHELPSFLSKRVQNGNALAYVRMCACVHRYMLACIYPLGLCKMCVRMYSMYVCMCVCRSIRRLRITGGTLTQSGLELAMMRGREYLRQCSMRMPARTMLM